MDHPFLDHPFLDNPFLDKQYGTDDASYFALPEQLSLEPGVRAAAVIKQLNENRLSVPLRAKISRHTDRMI